MKKSIAGLAIALVAAGLAGPVLTQPASGVSPGSSDDPRLVGRKVNNRGVVTLTWKSRGATITYKGSDPNAQVESNTLTPDGHGGFNAEGAVSSSIDLTKPAAQLVKEFGDRNPQMAASDPATAAALAAINTGKVGTRQALTAARAASPGPIIDSWCAQSDWDGDDVHAKTCNIRRLDHPKGSGANLVNWLAEQTTGSAWSDDGQHGDSGCINCDGIDRQSSGSQWKGEGTSPGQYRGILFTLLARTKVGVERTTLHHAVHIT